MVERAEKIFEKLLDLGLSEEDISRQVTEKLTEFQGFMTKEGALYLIGKDNGIDLYSSDPQIQEEIEELIDYNDFMIPIANITETMSNIVIAGRITEIFGVNSFIKKDGTPGVVGSFVICDKSECIKLVLWNDQTKIMETESFQKEEIIQIIGGYAKVGANGNLQIHLSRQGKIVLAPEKIVLPEVERVRPSLVEDKKGVKSPTNHTIEEIYKKEGFIKFVKGIVHIEMFKELTLKSGEKSFLLKLALSDDTASIRVNIWGMKAVEGMKLLTDGFGVKLTNVVIKENSYSNEKELSFNKSSRLEII
ncbi:MAG: hypothetical protein CEE43_18995 [Promethearchaeota archaeon Loki_b32]|nr:MAG: hypothetical protein CEE43_18995 [Candidatus Lokiarchaeota archaeon Loki_b32]